MANNYQQSSSWIGLAEEQVEQAKQIIARETLRLATQEAEQLAVLFGDDAEQDADVIAEFAAGCIAEIEDGENGVWLHHEDSFNPESAEAIARALIEELRIDEPFFCTWASTSSKPRIDEFGGGGFVVARGKKTYWIETSQAIEEKYLRNELEPADTSTN